MENNESIHYNEYPVIKAHFDKISSFCKIKDYSFSNQIFLQDLIILLEILIDKFNFLKDKNFLSIDQNVTSVM